MTDSDSQDFCDRFPDIHATIEQRMMYLAGYAPPEKNLAELLLKSSVALKGLYITLRDSETWLLTWDGNITVYHFLRAYGGTSLRSLLAQLAFEVRDIFAPGYFQDVSDFLAQKALPKSTEDADSGATRESCSEVMKPNPYGFDIVIGGKVRVRTSNQRGEYWLRIDEVT